MHVKKIRISRLPKTAKAVAKSADRALGLIIAKPKYFGGLPYDVFYS